MTEATPPSSGWRERARAGMRDGAPFAVASAVLSLSFGVVAREAGLSVAQAVVMSAIVFAGSAQFAAVAILSAGGGVGAAVGAAALMNSRFLPMGIALAPSLPGGPLRRAVEGQAVVDSSWAMAARPGGRFERHYLFGHTGVQYVGWFLGTVVGALAGARLGDARALGLDAVFPAFFAVILMGELRDARARRRPGGCPPRPGTRPDRTAGGTRPRREHGRAGRAPAPALRGMTDAVIWVVIALCAAVTFAIKAAGPVVLGGRELPGAFTRVVGLMAPALLAALIVTNALADGTTVRIGADTAGVATSALAFWRTGSVLVAIAVAVLVTAGLRAVGVGA